MAAPDSAAASDPEAEDDGSVKRERTKPAKLSEESCFCRSPLLRSFSPQPTLNIKQTYLNSKYMLARVYRSKSFNRYIIKKKKYM